MNIHQFTSSLKHAGRGLAYVFKGEQNFRLQTVGALLVVTCLVAFPLSTWERILLLILVIMVLTMELVNTALERFTDLLKPRLNYYVGTIKDIMAGAVLITSLGAVIIGGILLFPHFMTLVK